MQIRSPEMMLYRYFLSNWQNPISFGRIKGFTESLQELSGINLDASGILTMLLRTGSIEHFNANCYGLSPSCIVKGETFSIGVNLSRKTRDFMSERLIAENGLGLGIYHSMDSEQDLDVLITSYRFDDALSRYRPIRTVLKDWLERSEEIIDVKSIERYDAMKNMFVTTSNFVSGEHLYRIYLFGQHHFYYLYQQQNVALSGVKKKVFERSDLETLSIVKTVLGLNISLEEVVYLKEQEVLVINNYRSFPVTIEKLLYLDHVITNGTFPYQRRYNLSLKKFNQLQRLFNNKITIRYAKHIQNLERD